MIRDLTNLTKLTEMANRKYAVETGDSMDYINYHSATVVTLEPRMFAGYSEPRTPEQWADVEARYQKNGCRCSGCDTKLPMGAQAVQVLDENDDTSESSYYPFADYFCLDESECEERLQILEAETLRTSLREGFEEEFKTLETLQPTLKVSAFKLEHFLSDGLEPDLHPNPHVEFHFQVKEYLPHILYLLHELYPNQTLSELVGPHLFKGAVT